MFLLYLVLAAVALAEVVFLFYLLRQRNSLKAAKSLVARRFDEATATYEESTRHLEEAVDIYDEAKSLMKTVQTSR